MHFQLNSIALLFENLHNNPTNMTKFEIEEKIVSMLKTVFDPEIPVNVYDLGLIYKIDVSDQGEASIDMTLTAPNCPAADFIMEDVRQKVESIDGVMEHYAITKEDFAFVAEHDLLHTDLFGNVLSYLPAWKEACVEILMDFSVFTRDPQYECEKLFPFVDYVFFSADGIPGKELTGWMKKIQSYGPKLVTATFISRGAMIASP